MADEVITAAPTREALDMAHLQAMRAMSDQLTMTNRIVGDMAKDLKETRDAVLRLEAQELKATITANRAEALAAIDKLRSDHDADIDRISQKAESNSHSIARLQGIFLPLAAVGSGLLAFLGEWIANLSAKH